MGLQIHKLADTSSGERVVRYDEVTGEKKLVNPATPGNEHEPWPLKGVRIANDGGPSAKCNVSQRYVSTAVSEGWMTRVNERAVVRPAGRTQAHLESSQTGTPHVFIHADEIHIKTLDGDVKYRVIHQPDKYAATGGDKKKVTPEMYEAGETRVDWFYGLELING